MPFARTSGDWSICAPRITYRAGTRKALDGYRKALEMDPNLHVARSSLIACLDFIHDEGFEIFQHERRLYYEQHGSKVHPLTIYRTMTLTGP